MPTIQTTAPVVSKGPVAGGSPSGEEKGTQTSNLLTSYSVYFGTVAVSDLVSQRLTVIVNKTILTGCQYITGVAAAYMGFSHVQLPAPGTHVLVVNVPGNPYVIGIAPDQMTDPTWFAGNVAGDIYKALLNDTDGCCVEREIAAVNGATGYPYMRDMVPGEESIENSLGPVLKMLMNFARMSAGGLALVETHLLNDMVRVVSNYFVHHNCGGDDMIWSNGRCNAESHFTGYPHEAEGKLEETDQLAEVAVSGIYDPVASCQNTYSETGRWRLSVYRGFMADIIHTWVTDPTEVISNYMDNAHRAGKCRSWTGADGTFMVQSVSGIHMEVNPRVVVPAVKYAWNDPEFDSAKAIEQLNNTFLKLWGAGHPDWKDFRVTAWQMRLYAKYLTLWHSLSRWKQLEEKGYCIIPTEDQSPEPEMTSKEKDKEQVNSSASGVPGGYASISILPDGSIAISTGDTGSIVINQGNIQLNSANNIEINAAGTISLTGKSISAKALEHIEVVSLAGGLYLKARTVLKALCEKGRVWLKSDAEENSVDPGEWPAEGGTPIEPEMAECGIVLDAVQSKAMLSGNKGAIVTASDKEANVTIQATGSEGKLVLLAPVINLVAKLKYLVKAVRWAVSTSSAKVACADIKLGDSVKVSPAGVETTKLLKAQSVQTKGAHIANSKFNVVPEEPIELDVESSADEYGDEAKELKANDLAFDADNIEFKNFDWEFPVWYVGDDVLAEDSLKAGMTIDRCNQDVEWKDNKFYEVQWSKCRLEAAKRTNTRNQPWPGTGANHFEFTASSEPLGELWTKHFEASDIKGFGDMEYKPYRFMTVKS